MPNLAVEEMKKVAREWATHLYGPRTMTIGEPTAEMKTDDDWQTARVIITIPVTPTNDA
jgi:hypothetical protein